MASPDGTQVVLVAGMSGMDDVVCHMHLWPYVCVREHVYGSVTMPCVSFHVRVHPMSTEWTGLL